MNVLLESKVKERTIEEQARLLTPPITAAAIERLSDVSRNKWPGNVRELENLLGRALHTALTRKGTGGRMDLRQIDTDDLGLRDVDQPSQDSRMPPVGAGQSPAVPAMSVEERVQQILEPENAAKRRDFLNSLETLPVAVKRETLMALYRRISSGLAEQNAEHFALWLGVHARTVQRAINPFFKTFKRFHSEAMSSPAHLAGRQPG